MADKWRDKFARFMQGRYGMDRLGRFYIGAAFLFLLADLFIRRPWMEILALACLILCYLRAFSKNTGKRYQESQAFERLRFLVKEKIKKYQFKIREKKEYHIYKCPNCAQKIRIPRGKGRISVHCPKCSTDFIKKS